jgi:polysaccharide pyruvyl transferase WcaK-like protein
MKILIVGGNFINKGAEAMVLTAATELSKRIPRSEFFLPHPPEGKSNLITAEAAGLKTFEQQSESRHGQIVRLARCLSASPAQYRYLLARPQQCLRNHQMVEQVDGLVNVSGYAYGDPWPIANADATNAYLAYCQSQRKPTVFLPQSWGPFELPLSQSRYSRLYRSATVLYARETASQEHWARVVGVNHKAIPVVSDITFSFEPAPSADAQAVLKECGLDLSSQPLIVIAPNMRVYERAPGVGFDNVYLQTLARVILLSRKLGAAVLLLPHEINAKDGGTCDDRLLCSILKLAFREDDGVVAFTGEYSAALLKAVVAHCTLLIGSRYHALVAALSQAVPVVAIGWADKYRELLRLFDLEQNCFAFQSADGNALEQTIRAAWRDRERERHNIEEHLPALRDVVTDMFDHVAKTLTGRR